MRKIHLNFGGYIYMEELNHCEEEDRIKLYDSDQKYLDYFSMELFCDTAEANELSSEEYYGYLVSSIALKSTPEELLDWLGLEYNLISEEHKDIASALMDENIDDDRPLCENEWVNRLGDYYVLIHE